MSAEVASSSSTYSRASNSALWLVQILVAVAFLGVGIPKLLGDPGMVATFEKVGVGQWLRYLIGSLEVLGAIGLAALGLSLMMIGAMSLHFLILGAARRRHSSSSCSRPPSSTDAEIR